MADDNGLITVDFNKPLRPIVYFGLATGIALVALGVVGHLWLRNDVSYNNAAFAAGIALILATFGGQAVVRGKGIVFAGAAGIAAGFLGYLFYMQQEGHRQNIEALQKSGNAYLRAAINSLPEETYGVEIGLALPVTTRRLPRDRRIEFIARGEELKESATANIRVVKKTNTDNAEDDEAEDFSLKVSRDCLYGNLGRSTPLLWEFQLSPGGAVLVEEETGHVIAKTFGTDGDVFVCKSSKTFPTESLAGTPRPAGWFSAAFAGDINKISRNEIDRAIEDVQSTDSDVSRSARNILSRASPEDVSYILQRVRQKLKRNKDIYRTTLRVSLALTEMLRRDKRIRDRITLANEDIDMLLDFAGSKERSLRNYAGEFLYELARPQVTKLALPRALNPPHDDALFNWILVSQSGWPKMSAAEKQALANTIDQLRKKLSRPGYEKVAALLSKFK